MQNRCFICLFFRRQVQFVFFCTKQTSIRATVITECIESQKPLECISFISKKFFLRLSCYHRCRLCRAFTVHISTSSRVCVCRLCRALGAFVFLLFTFHLWNGKRMSTSQGRFIFHNTDYFLSHHCTLFLSPSLFLCTLTYFSFVSAFVFVFVLLFHSKGDYVR